MKKGNKLVIVLMIIMTILSFTNLLNIKIDGELLKLAGISVILGIVAYFVTRNTNESKNEGLDIKSTIKCLLKDKKVIILIIMPMIMNIICITLAKFCLPEYITHLGSRTDFLNLSELPKLILELAILALGEEIAWRAFFQKQAAKIMPFVPALIISSFLFAIGHFTSGSIAIVLYDLLFVFINSIFYGLVFKKTDNAWCSFIAHFLANLLGIFL